MALGYDAGESNRARADLGWGRQTPRDEDSLAKDSTRRLMRQKAADMRRNNPTVAGVCDRLALWTVGEQGIMPQCKTTDRGWNKAAEQWWAQYGMMCDYRRRVSMWDFQNMAVSLRPTHGGMYFQLLEDGSIVPIECERVQNPQDAERAKGWTDGVRVDKATGRTLQYCVHSRGEDGTFSGRHKEQYIDSANMLKVIRPLWRPDQVREIPDLAPILGALQDIDELNKYTLATAKWQTTIVGFLSKIGGASPISLPRGSNPTNTAGARPKYKTEWGEVLFGQPGEEMKMLNSSTPGANHSPVSWAAATPMPTTASARTSPILRFLVMNWRRITLRARCASPRASDRSCWEIPTTMMPGTVPSPARIRNPPQAASGSRARARTLELGAGSGPANRERNGGNEDIGRRGDAGQGCQSRSGRGCRAGRPPGTRPPAGRPPAGQPQEGQPPAGRRGPGGESDAVGTPPAPEAVAAAGSLTDHGCTAGQVPADARIATRYLDAPWLPTT